MTANRSQPSIVIDAPKTPSGADLSDHYPIWANIHGLKIISYNLQYMHTLIGGAPGKRNAAQNQRTAKRFADYFAQHDADICCVQELFDRSANAALTEEMDKRGYAATELLGASRPLAIFNGGVKTFVKKSLAGASRIEQYQYYFKNSIDYFVGGDATVNKGVMHVVLSRPFTKTHIFNLHLQAQYPELNRGYYEEVTLAQCIELKKFIDDQQKKGIIRPGEKIIVCGDFNIHQPADGLAETHFAWEKLQRLLGEKYAFLNYDTCVSGCLKFTRSRENSHVNDDEADENLDTIATVVSAASGASSPDEDLAECYCNIQKRITQFVMQHATVFSKWRLSEENIKKLEKYNSEFAFVIHQAELLKRQGVQPTRNAAWLEKAEALCQQPQSPRFKKLTQRAIILFNAVLAFIFNPWVIFGVGVLMLAATHLIFSRRRQEQSDPDASPEKDEATARVRNTTLFVLKETRETGRRYALKNPTQPAGGVRDAVPNQAPPAVLADTRLPEEEQSFGWSLRR